MRNLSSKTSAVSPWALLFTHVPSCPPSFVSVLESLAHLCLCSHMTHSPHSVTAVWHLCTLDISVPLGTCPYSLFPPNTLLALNVLLNPPSSWKASLVRQLHLNVLHLDVPSQLCLVSFWCLWLDFSLCEATESCPGCLASSLPGILAFDTDTYENISQLVGNTWGQTWQISPFPHPSPEVSLSSTTKGILQCSHLHTQATPGVGASFRCLGLYWTEANLKLFWGEWPG